MIQRFNEGQKYGNTKPRPLQQQTSAKHPMEILSTDLMEFKGQKVSVTVDHLLGFLTSDTLESKTSNAATRVLNNNFRKFGLQKRISYNGSRFRSEIFCSFLKLVVY